MSFLASLFVGRPLVIAATACLFVLAYYVMRFNSLKKARHPEFLLGAAVAWGVYAAWEWLVVMFTPEANIRVDLLLIWPVLALFSVWVVLRSLR